MILWDLTTLYIEFTSVSTEDLCFTSFTRTHIPLECWKQAGMYICGLTASDDPINRKPCFGIGTGVDVRMSWDRQTMIQHTVQHAVDLDSLFFFKGNFRILKWLYCTILAHIFWGSPLTLKHRP